MDHDYADLLDRVLLEELQLLVNVMTAATPRNRQLDDAELDVALGLKSQCRGSSGTDVTGIVPTEPPANK